ncbi:MAG: GTP-binding protein [archaeon]|nr:GTP-binding protein [archaeon]
MKNSDNKNNNPASKEVLNTGGDLSEEPNGSKNECKDSSFSNSNKGKDNLSANMKKYAFKVILLGDISVGKTAILRRFVDNEFLSQYKCNIGVEYKVKSLMIDEKTIAEIKIWDTSGDEKYRAVTRQYFKDAEGIFLVFDLTQESSFDSLQSWLDDIENNAPKDAIVFLVPNKSDLKNERKVPHGEIENFSDTRNLFFLEVSAKKGNNIVMLFEKMAEELVNNAKKNNESASKDLSESGSTLIDKAKFASKKRKSDHTTKCC